MTKIKPKQISKQVISLLLAILVCITAIPLTAFAAEGDIAQLVAGMLSGDANNHWIEYTNGVRLTAISAKDGSSATDSAGLRLPSVDWVQAVEAGHPSFQKYVDAGMWTSTMQLSKQDYMRGSSFSISQYQYRYKNPPAGMPGIVVDGGNNIDAIREFFTRDITIQDFCASVYDQAEYSSSPEAKALYARFESGELLLAIEPMAYFDYNGDYYGLTAHEAALLDKQTGRDVRNVVPDLVNNIAPKSLFLEEPHPELGYPNPKPAPESSGLYPYETILESCLGIGIVWLTPESSDPTVYHHVYNIKLKIPNNAPNFVYEDTNGTKYEFVMNAANALSILKGEMPFQKMPVLSIIS